MSENNNGEIGKIKEIEISPALAVRDNSSRLPYIGADEYEADIERTDEIHLRNYLAKVLRHKYLVLAVTGLMTLAAAIYLLAQEKRYKAETRVQVDYENSAGLGSPPPSDPSTFVDRAYFNTQLELLTSPTLIRRVIRKLDLENEKDFLPEPTFGLSIIPALTGTITETPMVPADETTSDGSGDPTDEEAQQLAVYVEAVQDSLNVQPVLKARQTVKDTRLIEIDFSHHDPAIAAQVTNTLADELVRTNLEKKTATNTTENRYLRANISELEAQIRQDEQRLVSYGRNYQLPTLEGSQNTVVERLVGLNKQLLEAEYERKQAEAAYKSALEPVQAKALAEEGDKQIADLDTKLDELRQRRALLLVEVTEKYPEVREIDGQIAVLQQQSKDRRVQSTDRYKTNLETRYRQALAKEESIKKSFEEQRGETINQNEAAINYRIIQQSIETNKKLLDTMTQRANENEMLKAKVPNNISIVDYALTPTEPVDQKRFQFLALAFVLSLSAGVGLALLRDYFDDAVHSAGDVERALSSPALAVIPKAKNGLLANSRRRLSESHALHLSGDTDAPTIINGGPELIFNSDAHSPINEAFRRLRTALVLSPSVGKLKKILVTSSQKSEGKTTTAINIATSLSHTGADVLLIDADLRRPRLHSIFCLRGDKGLNDILSAKPPLDDLSPYIAKLSKNFFVLPAGSPMPDSAEWLGSPYFEEVLESLAPQYGYIIIDSPPTTAFADSTVLATMVDGVLMVVQGNQSSLETVRHSARLLRMVGAKIVGVVINKVNSKAENYGSFYAQ